MALLHAADDLIAQAEDLTRQHQMWRHQRALLSGAAAVQQQQQVQAIWTQQMLMQHVVSQLHTSHQETMRQVARGCGDAKEALREKQRKASRQATERVESAAAQSRLARARLRREEQQLLQEQERLRLDNLARKRAEACRLERERIREQHLLAEDVLERESLAQELADMRRLRRPPGVTAEVQTDAWLAPPTQTAQQQGRSSSVTSSSFQESHRSSEATSSGTEIADAEATVQNRAASHVHDSDDGTGSRFTSSEVSAVSSVASRLEVPHRQAVEPHTSWGDQSESIPED
eukprot:CAMPEP_0178437726 /NCGR_PEP_ID=MMETSP0689_2-20121128/35166_1 /TAXON_ID=160604 /ORGANISM="Amphidinium massartii, Strain CS-259" /LENGTH=289 /DNA_ID=CAMNT_0020059987 /DNA_START=15 /DNA_END=881 /DNA_ORIENTATION=+